LGPIDQNNSAGAPVNAQEFEAQQTVDALFGYPYSLDWSMPQNVDTWLGLGVDGMPMNHGAGAQVVHPAHVTHVEQLGQPGMEHVMVPHDHTYGPPHALAQGQVHGQEPAVLMGAGAPYTNGQGAEMGQMGGMVLGMHGMVQGMYHPS
jgi:hypothetical protein